MKIGKTSQSKVDLLTSVFSELILSVIFNYFSNIKFFIYFTDFIFWFFSNDILRLGRSHALLWGRASLWSGQRRRVPIGLLVVSNIFISQQRVWVWTGSGYLERILFVKQKRNTRKCKKIGFVNIKSVKINKH